MGNTCAANRDLPPRNHHRQLRRLLSRIRPIFGEYYGDPGRWDEQSPRGLLRIPLARSFDITHTKNQDNSRAQLHLLAATGQLQGFLHVYLGMRDQRLPVPMSDFVARHEIADIGTNFRALTSTQLGLVSARAEQLTRCLIDHWIPELPALLSAAPAGWRRGSTVVT